MTASNIIPFSSDCSALEEIREEDWVSADRMERTYRGQVKTVDMI